MFVIGDFWSWTGLLPPFVFFCLLQFALGRRFSLSAAAAGSLLAVYSWAVLGTVFGSLCGWLSPGFAWAWWSLGLFAPLIAWRILKCTDRTHSIGALEKFEPLEWLCVIIVGCSLSGAMVMGLFSAPNNGDALIYHLPRQLIWISERTVFPDSLPYSHMHKMPPLTEWIGVQLYLLTGTDRFHFLIQWTAFAGSLMATAGIVRRLGGSRRHALLASAFFATLPAAFFQASNSKNDVFLAALILGIFWITASGFSKSPFGFWHLSGCAYLAGLAVLAKGTAFAFLPFAGFFVALAIFRNWRPSMVLGIAVGMIIFALTASLHYGPHFSRIFSSETGDQSQHANAKLGPATGASVFLRNYALQLALPMESWNLAVQKIAGRLAEKTGVPVGDPSSTFHGAPFEVKYEPFLEDRATGFLHFVLPLVILAGGCGVVGDRKLRWLALASALGFLTSVFLFSILFRYQIWHSRLMIPAIAVAAPGAGIFLGSIRWRAIPFALVLLLGLWLIPSFCSWARPVFGKLTVFQMNEEATVSRAGSGASFLPFFGRTIHAAGARNVWLDLQNGVIHAAMRYLPLSTRYTFPPGEFSNDSSVDAILTNRPAAEFSSETLEHQRGLLRMAEMEGWSLWMKPSLRNRLENESPEILPPLLGLEEIGGLGEWQGPYPEWQIPVFSELAPQGATFQTFQKSNAGLLKIRLATSEPGNKITISRNGVDTVADFPIDGEKYVEVELKDSSEPPVFFLIADKPGVRIYSMRFFPAKNSRDD